MYMRFDDLKYNESHSCRRRDAAFFSEEKIVILLLEVSIKLHRCIICYRIHFEIRDATLDNYYYYYHYLVFIYQMYVKDLGRH